MSRGHCLVRSSSNYHQSSIGLPGHLRHFTVFGERREVLPKSLLPRRRGWKSRWEGAGGAGVFSAVRFGDSPPSSFPSASLSVLCSCCVPEKNASEAAENCGERVGEGSRCLVCLFGGPERGTGELHTGRGWTATEAVGGVKLPSAKRSGGILASSFLVTILVVKRTVTWKCRTLAFCIAMENVWKRTGREVWDGREAEVDILQLPLPVCLDEFNNNDAD